MTTLAFDRAYEAIPSGGVIVPRPGRGLIRLTGPQRVWFLQNTITNDVESTKPGTWVESCFLDLKGKVLAHFRVGVLPDEIYLDVDSPGTADLLDWFTRYRFRTKVEIAEVSSPCCTILGPRAHEAAGPGEVRDYDGNVAFGGMLGEVAAAEVYGTPPDGSPWAEEEVHEILRLEAGLGRFGTDYGRDTLPQEAGLTPIVSVTKGCYVGQEVMARLHFRGHVNRTTRPLAFSGSEDPVGRALTYEEKPVGRVSSAAKSPRLGPIGMGMVRVEVPEGAKLTIEGGAEAVAGPLPEGTKVR